MDATQHGSPIQGEVGKGQPPRASSAIPSTPMKKSKRVPSKSKPKDAKGGKKARPSTKKRARAPKKKSEKGRKLRTTKRQPAKSKSKAAKPKAKSRNNGKKAVPPPQQPANPANVSKAKDLAIPTHYKKSLQSIQDEGMNQGFDPFLNTLFDNQSVYSGAQYPRAGVDRGSGPYPANHDHHFAAQRSDQTQTRGAQGVSGGSSNHGGSFVLLSNPAIDQAQTYPTGEVSGGPTSRGSNFGHMFTPAMGQVQARPHAFPPPPAWQSQQYQHAHTEGFLPSNTSNQIPYTDPFSDQNSKSVQYSANPTHDYYDDHNSNSVPYSANSTYGHFDGHNSNSVQHSANPTYGYYDDHSGSQGGLQVLAPSIQSYHSSHGVHPGGFGGVPPLQWELGAGYLTRAQPSMPDQNFAGAYGGFEGYRSQHTINAGHPTQESFNRYQQSAAPAEFGGYDEFQG